MVTVGSLIVGDVYRSLHLYRENKELSLRQERSVWAGRAGSRCDPRDGKLGAMPEGNSRDCCWVLRIATTPKWIRRLKLPRQPLKEAARAGETGWLVFRAFSMNILERHRKLLPTKRRHIHRRLFAKEGVKIQGGGLCQYHLIQSTIPFCNSFILGTR